MNLKSKLAAVVKSIHPRVHCDDKKAKVLRLHRRNTGTLSTLKLEFQRISKTPPAGGTLALEHKHKNTSTSLALRLAPDQHQPSTSLAPA